MSDVLIRDVPESVLAALDAQAARLGLSRSEYLRRRLTQTAAVGQGPVRQQDWAKFGDLTADLRDPDIMSRAWQ